MKEKCPNSFELKWHRVHQDDNNDNDNDDDNDDDSDDDSDDDNVNKKKERKKETKRFRRKSFNFGVKCDLVFAEIMRTGMIRNLLRCENLIQLWILFKKINLIRLFRK